MKTSIVLTAAALLIGVSSAQARILRIEVDAANSESPTYGGTVFAESGATYQKIAAVAYGEVDPADPLNAVIADIALAPRNPATGKVEYSVKFVLLKPVDPARGNHRVFAMLPNRGSPAGLTTMLGGNAGNVSYTTKPTAANAGRGFLMRKGFTILIPGWEPIDGAGSYSVSLPIVTQPDGSPVVGPSLEETVVDNDTTRQSGEFAYPVADFDKSKAKLTFRVRVQDPPVTIPAFGWAYNAAGNRFVLATGGVPNNAAFQRGLYEFVHPAKDPYPAALGLAALRDLMSYLKYSTAADNPLAGAGGGARASDVEKIYTHCFSQPCRMMHDFVHLGFNQDEEHRQVVDGILNWAGGADFVKVNYRFAQTGRTHRQHIGRWYPEFEFPFSNNVIHDSVTGRTDGRHKRCQASGTCPKSFMVNSENEYYSKAMSNLHYDRVLLDLPDEASTRSYLMSSVAHTTGSQYPQGFGGAGICTQNGNPIGPYPVFRAMLLALDDWVSRGIAPPASRLPRAADGTLVRSSTTGFPAIPARPAITGVDTGRAIANNGRMHTGDLFDYGPRYLAEGIVDNFPPLKVGAPYPVLAPKSDADGNNLAGIRLPEVAVPLATHAGWALRLLPTGADEGCDGSGMKVPFRKSVASRMLIKDPRKSIDERYASRDDYIARITQAANDLKAARLMLQEDVDLYVAGAAQAYDDAAAAAP